MIVDPYKLFPVAPTVAVLLPDGTVAGEHGDELDLDELPADVRVWASYDTVYELVRDGRGEALCWNQEEIRWRHQGYGEEGWKHRRSDVSVLKVPFPEAPEAALAGLAAWRDWLSSYGASPSGTTGSAAWSLLRARLDFRLYTGSGDCPPIPWTVGGRQELGPGGQGRYEGTLEHVDLPAAYASTLGGLPYGGRWVRTRDVDRGERPASWWAQEGRPVFVRARVTVPPGVGPLPKRPRRRPSGIAMHLLAQNYPAGVEFQGVWTFQELETASRFGCRVRELETWVHLAGERRPFARWWEAVQAGRSMRDPLGRQLAKMTGNALWGRFCMDRRAGGRRTIRSRKGRRLTSRPVPVRGGAPPAHDLAETVSGRVRARLYELMATVGGRLIAAHTDGAWITGEGPVELEGWRLKDRARRIDVLDPQVFRYWPSPPAEWEPAVVHSGIPAERAAGAFAEKWDRQFGGDAA